MKIGNVIYDKELINHTKVEYINYINNPICYDDIDKSLPTLYVGWCFMKDNNIDNDIINSANILNKKIVDNRLYWEFSFDESKASHVKGVDKFVSKTPEFYFDSQYEYINLDPVYFQLIDVDDILGVLESSIDNMYIYKKDMIYMIKDNKIWGIDLKMYEFFQFNIDELILRLTNKISKVINDSDGTMYQEYYKKFPNFIRLKRYIIVMLTK